MAGPPGVDLFDLDNTLTPRRSCVVEFASVFAADFAAQLAHVDVAELAGLFVEIDRGGYNPQRADELRERVAWREAPAADVLEEHWQRRFADAVVARPGTAVLLDDLATDGYKLGIITNGGEYAQNRKIDRLGLRDRMQSVLISDAVGCKKPDARIFQLACDELGAEPGDCWFVGDHPINDVRGAMQFGMTGVWIRDDETGHVWPQGESPPDHEIESLLELGDLLAGR